MVNKGKLMFVVLEKYDIHLTLQEKQGMNAEKDFALVTGCFPDRKSDCFELALKEHL